MLSRLAVITALALAVVMGAAWAAAPAIGIATAGGNFRIDRTSVSGNATILDGSRIETGPGTSELRLFEGAGMRLAGDSRGQVFRNRLVLEEGAAQVEAGKGYVIDAAGLRVQAPAQSSANVHVTPAGQVEVAAISGAVDVTKGSGVLLARVLPGKALAFSVQASGAAAPEKLTGILTESNGHYFVVDNVAGVKVELVGSDLAKLTGKLVEVTGTLDTNLEAAQSAAHVVRVLTIKAVATATKTAAAAGIGTKIGSAAASHALIAGVAVAAAAAPAAIALTSSDPQPGISR